MNDYQLTLFKQLEALVDGETFYRQVFESPSGKWYWIYNYRIASYSDFLKPGAFDCRGTMFEIEDDGRPVRLACLPMRKFFGIDENPFTQNLDLSTIVALELKADGSLMSTYLEDGRLLLKSKGAIASEQAIAANAWLARKENSHLLFMLEVATEHGYTVNLEWCAPEHRIVIGYEKPQLVVLNARHRATGVMMSRESLETNGFDTFLVERWEGLPTIHEKWERLPDTTGIEGFVVFFADGTMAKVKTDWYLSLHHAKDSVNSERRLLEVVLDEGTDDIKSMFSHDQPMLDRIAAMETKAKQCLFDIKTSVDMFWSLNAHLDRKSYAIKGQADVDKLLFGLVMSRYLGKVIDYKGFMKLRWKELGFKDDAKSIEVDA